MAVIGLSVELCFCDAGSRVLVRRTHMYGNVASGGSLFSQGGGIFSDIGEFGELQIESTRLSQNCANGSVTHGSAAGGALIPTAASQP